MLCSVFNGHRGLYFIPFSELHNNLNLRIIETRYLLAEVLTFTGKQALRLYIREAEGSSNGNTNNGMIPPSPSVALTLSPFTALAPSNSWMQQPERPTAPDGGGSLAFQHSHRNVPMTSELAECSRELEEGHKAWLAHKKETAWRMKRLEPQLESEKAARRREKMVEIESKVRALKEEQKLVLERIDAEYKEQIMGLRRDAEAKEQKLVDHWSAKHLQMVKLLEQMGCRGRPGPDLGGR